MTIRVVVLERSRLFREGYVVVFDREGDLHAVATTANAAGLTKLCHDHQPHVVVVEMDGDDWDVKALALGQVRADHPGIRTVGTCAAFDARTERRARQAGIGGVAVRTDGFAAVIDLVRSPLLSPVRTAARPLEGTAATPLEGTGAPVRCDEPVLTRRELSVLRLVGTGRTTRETSAVLGISPKTVENHKQRIFGKLGVQNQAHAIAIAMGRGILEPHLVLEAAVG